MQRSFQICIRVPLREKLNKAIFVPQRNKTVTIEVDQADAISIINKEARFWSHCTKTSSFPLRISSVNVTKSAVSCGFGHIY